MFVDHIKGQLVVDDWIVFDASPSVGVLFRIIREELDNMLSRKTVGGGTHAVAAGAIPVQDGVESSGADTGRACNAPDANAHAQVAIAGIVDFLELAGGKLL